MVQSSLCSWASFVFHLETKVLESGGRVEKLITKVAWSPVLSFHSLWWFGVQCHLLVLVHCVFCHCTRLPITFWVLQKAGQQKEAWRCIFHFPAGFGTCPHCQKRQKLVKCKLTRPEPHRKSMGYCQEQNEKRDQKMQMSWRPLSKKPGLPYWSSLSLWLCVLNFYNFTIWVELLKWTFPRYSNSFSCTCISEGNNDKFWGLCKIKQKFFNFLCKIKLKFLCKLFYVKQYPSWLTLIFFYVHWLNIHICNDLHKK